MLIGLKTVLIIMKVRSRRASKLGNIDRVILRIKRRIKLSIEVNRLIIENTLLMKL